MVTNWTVAEVLTIALYAVEERAIVVPRAVGVETIDSIWSTIVICTVWSATHASGSDALKHLTKYCLPHAAPFSQIPSAAAANILFVGNWLKSPPKHAVAASTTKNKIITITIQNPPIFKIWNPKICWSCENILTGIWRRVFGGSADVAMGEMEKVRDEEEEHETELLPLKKGILSDQHFFEGKLGIWKSKMVRVLRRGVFGDLDFGFSMFLRFE